MPRLARLDAPGTLHHVIVRGIERKKIVSDNVDRDSFVSRMGQVGEETQTSIYAWALMTNHAHILLRSGPKGLSHYMRRILSGYATTYNIRHRRHGHLFQNRYKSIVCDEDAYFMELVRYIHLNPLRAGIIKSVRTLDNYAYSGHSVLLGRKTHVWQDGDYVLSWFGETLAKSRQAYREYIKQGEAQGRRPDLVGGGLIRSMGGWSEVISMRQRGDRELADERILGSGEFVESILEGVDQRNKNQYKAQDPQKRINKIIKQVCEREGISIKELSTGSRRAVVSRARAQVTLRLVEMCGTSLAEIARCTGVSTSAVSKILNRQNSFSP